ncbi:MAG TPA: hypothetical protein VM733_17600 [Thermoanaerobaculia bacterium]|nr:hypothetical protein [Thermoanaerobaculia bacterium]
MLRSLLIAAWVAFAANAATITLRTLPSSTIDAEHDAESEPMPLPVLASWHGGIAAEEVRTSATAAEPALLASFAALGDDGTVIPPDTNGAAGPDHLVAMLNTQLRVQTRSGAELRTVSTRSIFDAVRNNGRVFDPRVVFDVTWNRWIVCVVTDQRRLPDNPKRTGSALLLAVSRSADPMGEWDLSRYESAEGVWLDYPQLGYDSNRIVVATNVYDVDDDSFVRASVFVIPKAPGAYAVRIDDAIVGGGLAPTVAMHPTSSVFLVQRVNGNSFGRGIVRMFAISNLRLSFIAAATSTRTWALQGLADRKDFAPQLGREDRISAGDDRILHAVYRGGYVYAVQNVYVPADNPRRAAVQWWQLRLDGTAAQRGIIEDTSNQVFYAYPSLAVNRHQDMLIGFTRFSANTYASAAYAFRAGTETTLTAPVIYKDGEAPYYRFDGVRNRWGDYSATVVDPINDTDFWTIQEYAATPSGGIDRWSTWWAFVRPPSIARRRTSRH